MKRSLLITAALAAAVSVAVGSALAATSSTRAATVATRSTALGRILVDGRGHTLYLFEKDRRGHSACSGLCASYWPPLLTHGKPKAAGAAKLSLLGSIRRGNGTTQVTYAGHPLYLFAQDTRAGQTHGQGMDAFGAEWYVLSSTGKKIEHGG